MGRRGSPLPALMAGVFLLVLFVIYQGNGLDVAQEYISLLPSLLLVMVCVYGVRGSRGVNQIIACAVLGVGFALMAGELNTLGVLVPDILAEYPSLTLPYLQALMITFTAIAGVAISRS